MELSCNSRLAFSTIPTEVVIVCTLSHFLLIFQVTYLSSTTESQAALLHRDSWGLQSNYSTLLQINELARWTSRNKWPILKVLSWPKPFWKCTNSFSPDAFVKTNFTSIFKKNTRDIMLLLEHRKGMSLWVKGYEGLVGKRQEDSSIKITIFILYPGYHNRFFCFF